MAMIDHADRESAATTAMVGLEESVMAAVNQDLTTETRSRPSLIRSLSRMYFVQSLSRLFLGLHIGGC